MNPDLKRLYALILKGGWHVVRHSICCYSPDIKYASIALEHIRWEGCTSHVILWDQEVCMI